MLIVSRGYYSLTYLFSYLLISKRYRVPTQSVVNKEAKSLALRVVALSLKVCPQPPSTRIPSDHVRPALKELHWLPVVYRIKFKLALMMFTIHTHQCPDYQTDSVHPYSNNDPACYRLRSATGTNYSVPRTRTKFGDGAFSVAGPVVWNSLPAVVRHADSLHSFKRRLKSHFFSLCFNDLQCKCNAL